MAKQLYVNSTAALLDVQQGIILGPLLFRVYKKKNMSLKSYSTSIIFADGIYNHRKKPSKQLHEFVNLRKDFSNSGFICGYTPFPYIHFTCSGFIQLKASSQYRNFT